VVRQLLSIDHFYFIQYLLIKEMLICKIIKYIPIQKKVPKVPPIVFGHSILGSTLEYFYMHRGIAIHVPW